MPRTKLFTSKGTPFTQTTHISKSDENTPSPDWIYVNLSLVNHATDEPPSKFPLCDFKENTNNPILQNPSEYQAGVLQFSMDGVTQFLPSFHFFTQDGSTTQGIYSVTLECDKAENGTQGSGNTQTFTQQTFVTYQPQNANAPNPNHKEDEFYHIYGIEWIQNLFNQALTQCFADVQNQFGANRTPNPQVTPPFFHYDTTTNRFSIYANTTGFGDVNTIDPDSTNGGERWRLYFNQSTMNAFSNFHGVFFNTNVTDGKNQLILFTSNYSQNLEQFNPFPTGGAVQNPPYFYKRTQEANALGKYWSPIESIVITSAGKLPLIPSLETPPLEYGLSRYSYVNDKGSDHTQDSLIEFSIDKENPLAWQQNLLYVANEIRYLSISESATHPLQELDIQFYYRDRFNGRLKELTLPPQSTAHMTLIFKKK